MNKETHQETEELCEQRGLSANQKKSELVALLHLHAMKSNGVSAPNWGPEKSLFLLQGIKETKQMVPQMIQQR